MINEARLNDFNIKLEALRKILFEKEAKTLLIQSQCNFSWLTGGRGFIGIASEQACATLAITMSKAYLITSNIESERLMQEELEENFCIQIIEYPWNLPDKKQQLISEIIDGEHYLNEADVIEELFDLRTVMSECEIANYPDLSIDLAENTEVVCRMLRAGISEFMLAGEISKKLWVENIEPITILIGFDERAAKYRHPVPTTNLLRNYAFISVCGRRAGLIASVTRTVCINKPSGELLEKHRMCANIDAILTQQTVAGNDVKDVFSLVVDSYKQYGYENEWLLHHQGGLTGYVPRELKATFESHHIIRTNEVYAWNPTIQGMGVEDTILVTTKGNRVLTHTGAYEYIEFVVNGEKILKPDILILNQ